MPTRPGIPRPGADSGRSALVVGAGIGGLGVARALGLAGWQVQVLGAGERLGSGGRRHHSVAQRRPSPGRPGCPDPRLRLACLGSAVCVPAADAGSRAPTLADYPARYGAPLVAVHRADLQQALLGTLPAGTTATGTRVTGITQDATGVSVQHSSGLSRASVVVLADGLASANRHLVTGTAVRPRYAGYTAWRGVTRIGAVLVNQSGTTESWGRGQRFGIVPLAGGRHLLVRNRQHPRGSALARRSTW
jgi:2-polyprenyl-6-methoxyphenol hydroxylase-like FAD-dependent oxidoreductase